MDRPSRCLALALVLAGTILAGPAAAQPQPLQATLVLKNPPPGAVYNPTSPTTPVTIVVQVQNVSPADVNTTQGFSQTEFWRRLFFTNPLGGIVTNTVEAKTHADSRAFFCHSRNHVLLRPTSIPVVPIEVLAGPPTPFFLEYTVNDARKFFDLSRSGRYTVNARIPFQTFTSDPTAIINDCDQLAGQTLVNVGAVTGRQSFTIVSNSLEFSIQSTLRFVGFFSPLANDSTCSNPSQVPCRTFSIGTTIPVKFQLFNANNAIVSNATAHLSVVKIGGGVATLKDDLFRFDRKNQQRSEERRVGKECRSRWSPYH